MLPKIELLKGIENLDRISRVLDQTDQAIKTWEVVFTDFLSPPELTEAQTVLAKLTEVSIDRLGRLPPSRTTATGDPSLPNRIDSRQLNLMIAADERHAQMYSRSSNNTVRQIWNLGAVNRCHSLSDVAVKRRFH
jgi:hypothetical protein